MSLIPDNTEKVLELMTAFNKQNRVLHSLAEALREMCECATREGWDSGGDRKVWAKEQADNVLAAAQPFLRHDK